MKDLSTEDYLEHIVESSGDILHFVKGISKDEFKVDRRTQKAVVMSIIEIGEAATRIMSSDPDFVANTPNFPWHNMRGMRNRIAHGYFDIDLDIVWETVTKAIPDLQLRASEILDKHRDDPSPESGPAR